MSNLRTIIAMADIEVEISWRVVKQAEALRDGRDDLFDAQQQRIDALQRLLRYLATT